MIKLYKNLDINQPVQFSSLESMKKTILKNPFMFDGLAYYENKEDEDCMVNLVHVDLGNGQKFWEVEEFPDFESSSYTIEEAVKVFAESLQSLGVW